MMTNEQAARILEDHLVVQAAKGGMAVDLSSAILIATQELLKGPVNKHDQCALLFALLDYASYIAEIDGEEHQELWYTPKLRKLIARTIFGIDWEDVDNDTE